ncbi:MAG: GAF domain-containing protein, partial [Thermodesulfobacteriota bacterium]|nr:GAF domain-containing protein [Thermodesulfobacteriota bacterium]
MPVAPEKTLEFERLLATLSSRFINLPTDQVESEINRALKRVVEFLDVDRSSFFELDEDKKTIVTIQSYAVGGIEPFKSNDVSTVLPWYTEKIIQGDIIIYSRLPDELPPEAATEKDYCRQTSMRSNLTIPIKVAGGGICAIAFGSFHEYRKWSDDLIPRLKLVGEIISNAMVRKRSDEKRQQSLDEIKQLQEQFEKDCIYLQE